MALRDDIINRSKGYNPQPIAPPKGTAAWADAQSAQKETPSAPKGSLAWADAQSGPQMQQASQPVMPASPQKEQAAPQPQPKRQTMEDLLKVLRDKPVLSEEEQKRSKREKLISNIGSGISALANLFFATKGAPSMWTARNSSAAANNAKWQQLVADRNREREAYINQQMKAKMYDDEAAVRDAQMAAQNAREERDNQRYQWEEELRPYKQKIASENARKATADADKAEVNARYAERINKAEIKRRNSVNSGTGRTDEKEKYTLNVAGKTYGYDTIEEYKKAVMSFAKKYKVDQDREIVETEDLGGDLKQEKKRKVRRDYADIAAEIEFLSNPDAVQAEQNTPTAKPEQKNNQEMRKVAKAEADQWSQKLNWTPPHRKPYPIF